MTFRSKVESLPLRYWLWTILGALAAALIVGIPTALVPTPLFWRSVAAGPIDYVIWGITSVLLGMIVATYLVGAAPADLSNSTTGGGFLSVLAVGCPVCNKIIVLALGASGALTYFAPIQPLIGLAAAGLLVYTLKIRFQQMTGACPLPALGRME